MPILRFETQLSIGRKRLRNWLKFNASLSGAEPLYGEASALRVEFSRAYHLTYDQVESVTKETYADYCHVLIQLDYMYNIPNIVRFVPEDTSKMDIKSFYSCLEKYGVALAVSPKTKERCIELGEKYGDQGLIDYVKFGHERVCSSQTVIDLNVDSNKPS